MDKFDLNLKTFVHQKNDRVKSKPQNTRKYLEIVYLRGINIKKIERTFINKKT
jgi:hypothetical protein